MRKTHLHRAFFRITNESPTPGDLTRLTKPLARIVETCQSGYLKNPALWNPDKLPYSVQYETLIASNIPTNSRNKLQDHKILGLAGYLTLISARKGGLLKPTDRKKTKATTKAKPKRKSPPRHKKKVAVTT